MSNGQEPAGAELAEQFLATAHALHQRMNVRMSAAGLSLGRFRVLEVLRGSGRMRMNELGAALGIVPRTVTSFIDALERDGLVARVPDPADRRATLLEISAAGRRQLRGFHELHNTMASELFAELTPTQRRQLQQILGRLRAAAAGPGSAREQSETDAGSDS